VDTGTGCDAPAVWPSNESVDRRPLPSPGSRRWRFPGFHGTMRRCDSLRTVTAGFLRVDPPLPLRLRRSSSLRSGPTPAWGQGARCGHPHAASGGVAGRPKFLGNPPVPMPCSPTPAGPEPPGLTVVGRGPPTYQTEGCPRVWQSRGSIARPKHSLSTLRNDPHGSPRKTRFRLPAQLYRVGLDYPQGSDERFP
jgi:hypothetical protein